MKLVLVFVLTTTFLITSFARLLAATSFTISDVPSSIDLDQPFTLNASIQSSTLKNKTYYLRVAIFETGTTKYFGYTKNQLDVWHNTVSDHTSFYQISTSPEGSWSGQLTAKADLESPYFTDSGEYQIKVGRYTPGGSLTWSDNQLSSSFIAPTPAPTPTPTPKPTPTPSPTPKPTSTPTASFQTPIPRPQPRTPNPQSRLTSQPSTSSGLVLSATDSARSKEENQHSTPQNISESTSPSRAPIFFSLSGTSFILAALFPKIKRVFINHLGEE